ncbi:hypothetical protein KM043_016870 [Ampulex compressa]|nr:hypothetical protein KM043_016870 [Ampulex compressa]
MIRLSYGAGSINHTKGQRRRQVSPFPRLSVSDTARLLLSFLLSRLPPTTASSSSSNSCMGWDIFFPPPCSGSSPGSIHHRHPRARKEDGKNSGKEEKRAAGSAGKAYQDGKQSLSPTYVTAMAIINEPRQSWENNSRYTG